VLSVAFLLSDAGDPLQAAIDRYRDIAGYEVTIKSAGGGKLEILRYYFRKPGHVRMEFVTPFNGAVLIYSPVTRQARLWPFGRHRFPALTLSPENRLIRSSSGQRVDRSDVGTLFENVKTLRGHGNTEIGDIETVGSRETRRVTVVANGFSIDGVASYLLWLDLASGFPAKVMSYDSGGRLIESVEMQDLVIDPEFSSDLFEP
jgi:outer membrane lipoprotein-sorting protein